MAAPARTARICRSPRPPAMARCMRPRITWTDTRCIALSTRYLGPVRTSPAAASSPPARMSSWTWIRTVPIPAIPPSSITKAPCTPSAGCFAIPTRSWSSTMMTRTMKPGRALPDSSPSGRSSASWKGRNTSGIIGTWTTSTAPADRLPAYIWNTRAGLRPTASPAPP